MEMEYFDEENAYDDAIQSEAASLLGRVFQSDAFRAQFRQSEDLIRQLIENELRRYYQNLEERIVSLIDERLTSHFHKVEFLIASKSCWMSPVGASSGGWNQASRPDWSLIDFLFR